MQFATATGAVPVLFSKLVLHLRPYTLTSSTNVIFTTLIAAKIVNTTPGPADRTQEVEKMVTIAPNKDLAQLFNETALADLPGLLST